MPEEMTILLVEDNDLDIELFKRGLKRFGISHPLVIARDGEEALRILDVNLNEQTIAHPFVVLLDINMPRMNGHEFLEAIRASEEFKSLRVFVFTTSENKKDVDLAYQQNVSGYIVKPNSSAELVEVLRRLHEFWTLCEDPSAPAYGSCLGLS
ncbi:response regulator [Sulfitobacter sp. S223]|uniref:response regulator n=1 Tax=Sulfitobacter sp. S223 TaxID=2867023 RepID=UPI0021A9332C|nr:response regulator [Sulfitobacter sp. S223]UWR25845.1 response regulator [Sulfitobacter sp. S223]